MLNHYRNIKRKHFDHQVVEDFVKVASREKRAVDSPQRTLDFMSSPKNNQKHRTKRESRDYTEIDRAYLKYYERIKAKYRNNVQNLFPILKTHAPRVNNSYPMQPSDEAKNTRRLQVQDGRWYNPYSNPEFRYRATHRVRTFSNDNSDGEDEGEGPLRLPNINDPTRSNRFEYNRNESVSNYFPSYLQNNVKNYGAEEPHDNFRVNNTVANIYAQLQSQIVKRKKRESDGDGKSKWKYEL